MRVEHANFAPHPPTTTMDPRPVMDDAHAEDILLMGRVAAHDQQAFARLFDRHSAVVLGVLTRLLGERALAEEILQEAFLQAWQQADRYQPALATPRGWLLMMARSRALDRLRSRGARQRREDEVMRDVPVAAEPTGTAAIEADERRRHVIAALGSLPAEQRECIELAFFSGLPHTQIAERLQAPLGTVKSRILLGMNKLRHSLASYS
jgi:RNA polymerase sigma-70 factor (ECF subfamily)